MPRTNVVSNLDELFIYAVLNPWSGNGVIKKIAVKYLDVIYDGGSVVFVVGLLVTGGSSGATGRVISIGAEASGTLVLDNTSGTFEDNEVITDSGTGAAVVNGVPSPHISEVTRDADDVFSTADAEVIVRATRGLKGTTAAVVTVAQEIDYTGKVGGPFQVGETVTESVTLRAAVVVADNNAGATGTGTLTLKNVSAAFAGGNTLTGDTSGATAAGTTYSDRQATFAVGDPPDEAKQVAVAGEDLSPMLNTGAAAGDAFEILRGLPDYGSPDYLLYAKGKTHEEGEMTTPIRDKGQLQENKVRADIERSISLTLSYLNSKAGLLALTDQDIIIIAEREDDRAGVITEYHYYLQARINADNIPDESEGDEISGYVITARFERAYTLAG